MSDSRDPDVTRLLRDLTRELQVLKRELDEDRTGRMSTRRQLSRFTSEVAIPGIILLLETNIRALKLLRRTIRLAEGREPNSRQSRAAAEAQSRAEQLGAEALTRLDDTLQTVQSSLAEEGANEEVRQLLGEARGLQDQISQQLDTDERGDGTADSVQIDVDDGKSEPVNIDVDAELQALKDNLEDGSDRLGSQSDDGDDRSDSPSEDDSDGNGDDPAS